MNKNQPTGSRGQTAYLFSCIASILYIVPCLSCLFMILYASPASGGTAALLTPEWLVPVFGSLMALPTGLTGLYIFRKKSARWPVFLLGAASVALHASAAVLNLSAFPILVPHMILALLLLVLAVVLKW